MTLQTSKSIAHFLHGRTVWLAANLCAVLATFVGVGVLFHAPASANPAGAIVSQKDRSFTPSTLAVRSGETVTIVADDGTTVHHAYADSETFSFDSGDQDPGTRTPVVFGVPGTFTVMCGIHPRMKLTVKVD